MSLLMNLWCRIWIYGIWWLVSEYDEKYPSLVFPLSSVLVFRAGLRWFLFSRCRHCWTWWVLDDHGIYHLSHNAQRKYYNIVTFSCLLGSPGWVNYESLVVIELWNKLWFTQHSYILFPWWWCWDLVPVSVENLIYCDEDTSNIISILY